MTTPFAASALQLAHSARAAATSLAVSSGDSKNRWLAAVATGLRQQTAALLAANQRDLDAATTAGISRAMLDRLTLTPDRIESLAKAVEHVISLPDPVGEVIDGQRRPNGLSVSRVRVPLGVVFFIYESRPNVTIDAAALCLKSGNAVILRGGREALHTNQALAAVLTEPLTRCGLPESAVQLVQSPERELVGELLQLGRLIDVTIPRGGRSLIERVTREATMPVIKHFDGICHVFVDRSADLDMAEKIVLNAKCQRPGVCNALETVLVHRDVAEKFLPKVAASLAAAGVELRGDVRTCEVLANNAKSATEADWSAEYLELILSIRVVDSLEEAVEHIENYGSHHTDSIVTADESAARKFLAAVDSATVLWNASTRFSDGGEFGFGAEIGISTDKLHARGPMGLEELTTYKYLVEGTGQVRG